MDLLSALGTLSLSSLANVASSDTSSSSAPASMAPSPSSGAPSQALFSLTNLVGTIEHNLFRIGDLWSFALDHLSCVVRHRVASIRLYGIQCTARLVKMALKQITQKEVCDHPAFFTLSKRVICRTKSLSQTQTMEDPRVSSCRVLAQC